MEKRIFPFSIFILFFTSILVQLFHRKHVTYGKSFGVPWRNEREGWKSWFSIIIWASEMIVIKDVQVKKFWTLNLIQLHWYKSGATLSKTKAITYEENPWVLSRSLRFCCSLDFFVKLLNKITFSLFILSRSSIWSLFVYLGGCSLVWFFFF